MITGSLKSGLLKLGQLCSGQTTRRIRLVWKVYKFLLIKFFILYNSIYIGILWCVLALYAFRHDKKTTSNFNYNNSDTSQLVIVQEANKIKGKSLIVQICLHLHH